MYEIWEAFNDIAEGFGLTIEEFQEILKSAIMEYLNVTERQLNFDTDAVFRLFDDDQVTAVSSLDLSIFIDCFVDINNDWFITCLNWHWINQIHDNCRTN